MSQSLRRSRRHSGGLTCRVVLVLATGLFAKVQAQEHCDKRSTSGIGDPWIVISSCGTQITDR